MEIVHDEWNVSQSDKVEMWWNRKGTGALVIASMEVDKTGSSYYGKQSLQFVSVRGDTSMVPLSKYVVLVLKYLGYVVLNELK